MSGKIYYINKDKEVRHLSNFSKFKVVVNGVLYNTSEHYFQAAKFFDTDPEWAQKITETTWPSEAFKLGKSREHKIHPDWDNGLALKHMGIVLREKFKQNKEVCDQLLETGDAYIVERADWDDVWGDGKDRWGKNQLGRLCMKIRNEIKRVLV